MSRILVIGSSNTDMVIKTKKLPAPGETILGGTFLMNPGGKGANQAVAAARLGGKVIPVDTTAAGDIFNGALAVAISEGKGMKDAVVFANLAASISVTRMGAQASAPYKNELNK